MSDGANRADNMPPRPWGCVHGRFQPFHRGHLEYALLAKKRCRWLVVGITNPDPSWVRYEETNPQRHEPDSNPFTYFERTLMIRDSLLGAGLREEEFVLVPFPIQEPELLRHYTPAGAVHFVRAYSDWEWEKIHRLRTCGLNVEVLDPGSAKEVSGGEVREALRSGLPWEHLVPAACADNVRLILAAEPERMRRRNPHQ